MKHKFDKRLFIGIPAGYEIKYLLPDIQSSIQCNPNQINWVSFENIHMTLFFLGNVPLDDIPLLIQALKNVLNLVHFRVSIEKTGVFPSSRLPKILWLGVGNGRQKMLKLHEQVRKGATSFKVRKNKDDFIPHITIGRTTRSYGKIDVLPFLKYVYSPRELDINSIALYESQLLPKGVKYKILTEFPLN